MILVITFAKRKTATNGQLLDSMVPTVACSIFRKGSAYTVIMSSGLAN